MAPPAPAKGLAGRFTRKVGPLPVWAWAALILGAFLLYSRMSGSSPAGADETPKPEPVDGTEGGGAGPVAGGSSPPTPGQSNDLLAELYGVNAGTIDSLTAALLTQRSLDATAPQPTPGTVGGTNLPQGATDQEGPASSPIYPNGPGAAPAKAAPRGTSQRQSNVLVWDNQRFTTKAGFDAWLKARGLSARSYLANRPQAKAIYSTLA